MNSRENAKERECVLLRSGEVSLKRQTPLRHLPSEREDGKEKVHL